MAILTAFDAFHIGNIDFNIVVRNQIGFWFEDDINLQSDNAVYEDLIIYAYLGGGDRLAFLGGSNISLNPISSAIVSGEVNLIADGYVVGDDSFGSWVLEGVSVGAVSLYNAALSTSVADDSSILMNALSGDDGIVMSNFNDFVSGYNGNDSVFGGLGDDTLLGGNGHDALDGGDGNDTLNGGRGNDSVWGDFGADRIDGFGGHDQLTGGTGRDVINGGIGNDELRGGNGNDRLIGGNGDDTTFGGNGKDKLRGGGGNDDLRGGNGDDVLDGGAGNDILRGGANADVLVFSTGDDRAFGFAEGDLIDLRGATGITDFADLQTNHLTGGVNAVIEDDLENTLTLVGLNPGLLDEGDFIF